MVKIRAAERISILGGRKKEGQICAGVVYMHGKMLPPRPVASPIASIIWRRNDANLVITITTSVMGLQ